MIELVITCDYMQQDEALCMALYRYDAAGHYFRMPDIALHEAYREQEQEFREVRESLRVGCVSGKERSKSMAKFQLCEFRRTKDAPLERGLARVKNTDKNQSQWKIEYVIDVNGNKVNYSPHSSKLLFGLANTAIDTANLLVSGVANGDSI